MNKYKYGYKYWKIRNLELLRERINKFLKYYSN